MNHEEQLQEIGLSEEQANKQINLAKAFDRLKNNADFKLLIEENYFKEEASRLVVLKADPQMQSQDMQMNILNSIDAIGHFRQYLITINQIGKMAEKAKHDAQVARAEMERDELGEE